MSAATLAELSQGRFVLGLGSSSHAIIEDWNGLPFELPLTRLRETVTVVRQALAGGKTSFEGKTLRSRGFRLGNPPARPVPIYLAALREKMLALAGEIGDGVIVNLFPVTALPQMLAALRSGAARAGRDASGFEVVCRFQVAVTDDVAVRARAGALRLRQLLRAAGLQRLPALVRLRSGGARRGAGLRARRPRRELRRAHATR